MKGQARRKILLIDDDASLLITLSDFLSFEGYDVVTADCAEEGLEVLKSMTPNLIILDMSMPGMGGVGFLKEITSASGKPQYPVLVLTARANMAEFFANMDVDGFIAKPCDPADLLMEVGRIVFLRSGPENTSNERVRRGGKVLIAEDDIGHNQRLMTAFSEAGYDVCSVVKGPDVLEKSIIEKPDFIVIKLVLSNMNGDVIAGLLQNMPNTKNIPIVLYNEGKSDVPASKYIEGGTGIKKFVQNHSPESLIKAVADLLN